jgi:ribosome biogenesis protein Nip4
MKPIIDFIKKFTDAEIVPIKKIHRSYYLVNKEIEALAEKIEENLFAEGLFLGKEKDKRFKPSVALLEIISKTSDRKIFVDDKAEWLFLCGRDIFGKSITKANVKRGLVLVQNKRDENLGFAKITGDITKKDLVVVTNILDRGDFLRRERKKR